MHPSPSAPPECGAPDIGLDIEAMLIPDAVPFGPADPLEEHELFEALVDAHAARQHVDTEAMRMHAGYAHDSLGREKRLRGERIARADEDETR